MIDLKQTPELLRSAKSGDRFTLDGDSFTFNRVAGGICLTSIDSKLEEFMVTESASYGDYIRHVRVDGIALLSINELIEAINRNTYTIDKGSNVHQL